MSSRSRPDIPPTAVPAATAIYRSSATIAVVGRGLAFVNRMMMVACVLAYLGAAGILTYSVATRYFLKMSTDWQDEASVFLLVGSVFLSSAFVQSHRGHIGIQALAGVLPEGVNRVRLALVDVASLAFCGFFAWKSWTLLIEAVRGAYTTGSEWSPPLWIPYSTMAVGMSLLCVQILLQVVDFALAKRVAA
jgi:TRAP-type C4-dicarboxylate transport system permease small subunit